MPTPREIVERLGGHASEALALDLGSDEGLFRWLLAACLLAGRVPEERALEAFRALSLAGLDRSEALGQPRSEDTSTRSTTMLIFEMLFVILHRDGRPSEFGQYDRRLGRK